MFSFTMKTKPQKIEKWRVEELALTLKKMAALLKKGDNYGWANVLLHFHQEAQMIIDSKEFNLIQLKKLLVNINNCFAGMSSLANLILWHENSSERKMINQDLNNSRSRLLKILAEIETRTVEYVS